ncbi:hypothetical protein KGY64_05645 [Candidatus Bipolaricaulota bacterium]|nr:hypothetical protein [Candidatus Bipolaricaulota bacterium]
MKPDNIEKLKEIAEIEFDDIVANAEIKDINEIRIFFKEASFIDVWFSLKLEGKYSYHWERSEVDGSVYRHDNVPHERWQHIKTFPKHFHDSSEADEDCNELQLMHAETGPYHIRGAYLRREA